MGAPATVLQKITTEPPARPETPLEALRFRQDGTTILTSAGYAASSFSGRGGVASGIF